MIMAPVVDQLAREYAGRVVFAKLNINENPKTASSFAILAVRTLLIFKNGIEVDQIVGAVPREDIEAKLRILL